MSLQELEQAILALNDPKDLIALHEVLNQALRRSLELNRAPDVRHSAQERMRAAQALHGSIRPTNGDVPNDDDVRRIIEEARMAKHG